MSKEKIVRKLTSRKLWMSIASFVSMLVIAMGKNQSEAAQISALIIAGATVIAYVVGEGLVDYSNIEDKDENIESRD
jgi:hypothetical protein